MVCGKMQSPAPGPQIDNPYSIADKIHCHENDPYLRLPQPPIFLREVLNQECYVNFSDF